MPGKIVPVDHSLIEYAKEIKCSGCGELPKIYPEDNTGPFTVECPHCGYGTLSWAYQREAWENWKNIN